MEPVNVKILSKISITPDVVQIITEKPRNFEFIPGQAAEISLKKEGWSSKIRPFSFTSLPDNDYLQFIIKTYPEHKGFTSEVLKLEKNDELVINKVFGSISYRGEGLFIAGGAGVTPFVSILRYLYQKNAIGENKLIFANKTKADIILKNEFEAMLSKNFINILSDEKATGYLHGFVTKELIVSNLSDPGKYLYLCGPPRMMKSIEKILAELHISEELVIKERF